jgi:Leucine-rich repeat (LRR) protein
VSKPARKALLGSATRLLYAMRSRYGSHVLSLEGKASHPGLDVLIDSEFEAWAEGLRDAPQQLLEARALRTLVEEALAAAQLKELAPIEPSVGRVRATELSRDFARSLDLERFVDTRDRTCREWLELASPLPAPMGPTHDDARLRSLVAELPDEERRGRQELTLQSAVATLSDLKPLSDLPALRKLVIRHAEYLKDLSPLAELPALEELELWAPRVRDLSAVARLTRLRRVSLRVPSVRELPDLSALRSLEELSITSGRPLDVRRLAPLDALRSLHLEPVGDLGAVGDLVHLRALSLSHARLTSLDFLSKLTSLVSLAATSCASLVDIRALAHLGALEELDLSISPVSDVFAVSSLTKLRALILFGTRVRRLPSLAALVCLEKLDLGCVDLETLSGIEQACALKELSLGPADIPNLAPLASVRTLERLHISCLEEQPLDLAPLRGLTKLETLTIAGATLDDLSPLSGLRMLSRLGLPRTPIQSVESLAGLPELRYLDVTQCYELESLRPLASCPKLESIEVYECDALRGPTTVEELRAPPERAAKTFPSAGPPKVSSSPATLDGRNHLPQRPPERWSLPLRSSGRAELYHLEADGVRVSLALFRDEHAPRVVVYLAPFDRTRLTDKRAARILRRFRACGDFVEVLDRDELLLEEPHVRCFAARAYPASPATWGQVRHAPAPIRVDAPTDTAAPSRMGDVRNHLPSPLPHGWSLRPVKAPDDVGCFLVTPEADITVVLRPVQHGDTFELAVGIFPREGELGDGAVRSMLEQFRARGAFEEQSPGPFADVPSFRLFKARAR